MNQDQIEATKQAQEAAKEATLNHKLIKPAELSTEDAIKVMAICKRIRDSYLAGLIYSQLNISPRRYEFYIIACHQNGTKLDLQKLLDFDDSNFNHDIIEIVKNLDTQTGVMQNFSSPRSTAKG
jgi:hypothetical protein